MQYTTTVCFVFMFWCQNIDFPVLGERACFKHSIVLDSCDGRTISNNFINMDFGAIMSKCSCTVEPINNAQYMYTLSKYPRYSGCGTGIQIRESNNVIRILLCSAQSPGRVFTNLSSIVKFIRDDPRYGGTAEYCLQVFTNSASNIVKGYCGTSKNSITLTSTTHATDLNMFPSKRTASYSTEHTTQETDGFLSTINHASSRLTVGTTVYSTEESSSEIGEEATTINKDLIVIIAVAAGSCVLLNLIVGIIIIVKMIRQRHKDNILKNEVTHDVYAQRKLVQPENTLHQIAETSKFQTCNSSSAANNGYSELQVVVNTIYESAYDVIDDENQLDTDDPLYTEIIDNENDETAKLNGALVYDYAYVTEDMLKL